MTADPIPAAMPGPTRGWSATRTIQALAVVCVALALMCLGLALMWQRQHETAECWRAAAEYHLAPDTCGGQAIPLG